MKCPLLHHTVFPQERDPEETFEDCLEEECAWWGCFTVARSDEHAHCCIPVLTEILSEIMTRIAEGGKQ